MNETSAMMSSDVHRVSAPMAVEDYSAQVGISTVIAGEQPVDASRPNRTRGSGEPSDGSWSWWHRTLGCSPPVAVRNQDRGRFTN